MDKELKIRIICGLITVIIAAWVGAYISHEMFYAVENSTIALIGV